MNLSVRVFFCCCSLSVGVMTKLERKLNRSTRSA